MAAQIVEADPLRLRGVVGELALGEGERLARFALKLELDEGGARIDADGEEQSEGGDHSRRREAPSGPAGPLLRAGGSQSRVLGARRSPFISGFKPRELSTSGLPERLSSAISIPYLHTPGPGGRSGRPPSPLPPRRRRGRGRRRRAGRSPSPRRRR